MYSRYNILFLTLRVFSATGGIEKVCRVVCKALSDFSVENLQSRMAVFSMYDFSNQADEKYVPANIFKGFGQQKINFVKAAVQKGCNSKVVILSHINLLLIGYLIKIFSPRTKIILFAHGIEVWEPLNSFKKHLLKNCDKILCVSAFTQQKMIEVHQLKAAQLMVLNNCLDPFLELQGSAVKDEKLLAGFNFTKTDIILLTLTRLSSKELYKGYDHVMESIHALKQEYPQIKYLLVGNYDAAEKQRLDGIIQKLSLQNQVVFTGYIPDEELSRHYQLADVYIMPSKKEGFGIVFIEAMYYGLPVIAGNKDGSADALLQGRLGLLINPDDQAAINDAIKKVLVNTNDYKPNHALLMAHFGFDVYKEKLKNILQQQLMQQ